MIHASAIIDKSAKLDKDVSIGPYSVIGADVEIKSGSVIGSHALIEDLLRLENIIKFFLLQQSEEIRKIKNMMEKKLI